MKPQLSVTLRPSICVGQPIAHLLESTPASVCKQYVKQLQQVPQTGPVSQRGFWHLQGRRSLNRFPLTSGHIPSVRELGPPGHYRFTFNQPRLSSVDEVTKPEQEVSLKEQRNANWDYTDASLRKSPTNKCSLVHSEIARAKDQKQKKNHAIVIPTRVPYYVNSFFG